MKDLKKIADELNITVAQLAIAWTLRLPEVNSSLTGASKPEYIKSNVKAIEVELSTEILLKIEERRKKARKAARGAVTSQEQ